MITRRRLRRAMLPAAVLCAVLAAGLILYAEFGARFDELSRAQSDNVQWTLSQVEVEYLALDAALLRAQVSNGGGLEGVRRRFDIFYSRLVTLRNSPVFAELRTEPEFARNLAAIWQVMQDGVPLIDSPDAGLSDNLAALETAVAGLAPHVRAVGLEGIAHFAALSDQRRDSLMRTLTGFGQIAFVLILALLAGIFVLRRTIRISEAHARDARSTAARMAAVVRSSLDAVIVADREGRIVETNDAIAEVFGYRPDEVVGRKMSDTIVPPHLRAAHEAGMQRYIATGERRVIGQGRVQLEAVRKNGSAFPVELSIAAAETRDGEIFVSFLRDITRRVTTEKDLREARDRALDGERAKSAMLATMSHEMRTPLNGMLGTLDILSRTPLDPRQLKLLSVIRTSGDTLLHHVNDVLDIARIEAGHIGLRREVFDLPAFVAELADSQRAAAEAAGNTLEVTALPPLGAVLGDPGKLRQILLNLIGNAVKFTEHGAISVEAERLGTSDTVELRVIDTGAGIPEAEQDRIFEDFVTLEDAYTRRHGGTGLGLGIVRRLVQAIGGEISVDSEPGEGSLFAVRLPLPAAEPAAPSAVGTEDAPEIATRPLAVLLVEDNAINRMIAREMLGGLGHAVTEAENGALGVEAAAAHPYDLILMDISMPVMDGVTAAQAIRGGDGPNADTPILALTAHALPEEIRRFEAAGMARTLVKPITRAALSAAIAAATGDGPGADAPPGTAPDGPAVDRDLLETLARETGGQFPALLEAFVAEMDAGIAVLAGPDAAALSDAALVARIHALAGTAGLFGATALRVRLAGLESRGKAGDGPGLRAGLPALGPAWQEARALILDPPVAPA